MKIDDQHQPDATGKYSWKQHPILVDSMGACFRLYCSGDIKSTLQGFNSKRRGNLHQSLTPVKSLSLVLTTSSSVSLRMYLKCLWNPQSWLNNSSRWIYKQVVLSFSLLFVDYLFLYLLFFLCLFILVSMSTQSSRPGIWEELSYFNISWRDFPIKSS